MAMKRVIAYFMHEREEGSARGRLQNVEGTESYLLGDIEESEIADLEKEGLIVQEATPPGEAETPGRLFEVLPGVPRTMGRAPGSVETLPGAPLDVPPPDRATYYLVQLEGPMLEERRKALSDLGVELLEYVPRSNYKVLLTPTQVGQVQALAFVRGVRYYDRQDTGPVMRTAVRKPAPPAGRDRAVELRQFDVRIQPAADSKPVRDWLEQRHVPVAGVSRRKIRVYFDPDSPLLLEIAALPEVEQVEEYVRPKLHNDVARELLGIDPNANPGAGIALTGRDQIVAVADTGLDETHPDFQGRVVGIVALGRPNDATDPHGHGTHVSGSVLGSGAASSGKVRGTAPGAQLFFQSLLDSDGGLGGLPLDLADLFQEAFEAGARIHNNSWGAATNSMYTMNSDEVDEFVASHRDMLIVISAGNEGTAASPQNAKSGFVDWLSIGSPASAKNALVVGASRSRRTSGGLSQLDYGTAWPQAFPAKPISAERISGDSEAMAAFSSRGPCDDRRIKPDLVAPGTDIASTKSARAPLRHFWGAYPNKPRYAFMGGTSMAAPLVSGCAALVREYYVTQRQHEPSAALLKATLINGTRWLSGADAIADHSKQPNFHQGFGCLYLPAVIPSPAVPNLRLEFRDTWKTPSDQFERTGQRFRYRVDVSGGTLSICLVWTDAPGRGLQNSLALLVENAGSNKKWVANADLPLAIMKPDPDNNVQLVRIDLPPAGQYVIQVFARNLLRPPQDFALVVAGQLTSALTTY
jgi:subtilisin family serine protease